MSITERAAIVLREIDEALAMSERATPGPWETDTQAKRPAVFSENGDFIGVDMSPSNSLFVSTSRTGWPKSLRSLKTAIEVFLAIIDVEADEKGEPEPAGIVASAALTTLCDQWQSRQ